MGAFIARVIALLPLSISSAIAIVQVVIKLIKEIITLLINLLFPLFPDGGKFEQFVLKVRDFINVVDELWEKLKVILLKLAGATK